jgi:integrase
MPNSHPLGPFVRRFLLEHIVADRNLSLNTQKSYRDALLLLLRFVAERYGIEPTQLTVGDLNLGTSPFVTIRGKGRKERLCPLWPETANALRVLLGVACPSMAEAGPIFRNHRGEPLTRFGVRYVLRRYAERARTAAPTLAAKRVHPHSYRHSSAVHLLRAGVDLVTISHWLGHATVETTNRYAAIDLETKHKALEQAGPVGTASESALTAWRTDASVLEWLETL